MSMNRKIFKTITIFSTAAMLLAGCGSAPNDQGVSFSLLGYMAIDIDEDTGERTCSIDTSTSGYLANLGTSSDIGASATLGCILLQNNLTGQFIRAERVNLSYFIAGASEQPPSTVQAQTVVLGPLGSGDSGTTSTGPNTTLPPGFTSLGNRISTGVFLIPDETHRWLSLNRDKLPDPPFIMQVTASVTGVTSAGDVLVSNEAGTSVEVVSDITINDTGSVGDENIVAEDTVATDEEIANIVE